MGVAAAGNRIPGNLSVPSLDAVPPPQAHPHIPDCPVGLPLADLQNHAWSGRWSVHVNVFGNDILPTHLVTWMGRSGPSWAGPGWLVWIRDTSLMTCTCPPHVGLLPLRVAHPEQCAHQSYQSRLQLFSVGSGHRFVFFSGGDLGKSQASPTVPWMAPRSFHFDE